MPPVAQPQVLSGKQPLHKERRRPIQTKRKQPLHPWGTQLKAARLRINPKLGLTPRDRCALRCVAYRRRQQTRVGEKLKARRVLALAIAVLVQKVRVSRINALQPAIHPRAEQGRVVQRNTGGQLLRM